MQPDLSGQLAEVIAALEKATPEVVAMAERTIRMDAALHGVLFAIVLVVSSVTSGKLIRRLWILPKTAQGVDGWAETDKRVGLWILSIVLVVVSVVMLCQLPGQTNQFFNARYYAVCDLLRQARP